MSSVGRDLSTTHEKLFGETFTAFDFVDLVPWSFAHCVSATYPLTKQLLKA